MKERKPVAKFTSTRRLALWFLVGLATVVWGCGGSERGAAPPPAPTVPQAPASKTPTGRIVFRPKMQFGAREAVGGTAFFVSTTPAVAVTSSHLVLFTSRGSTLSALHMVDADTKAVRADALGLAMRHGAAYSGLDYSSDFAFVVCNRVPEDAVVCDLSASAATEGEPVDILVCPSDGSNAQTVIQGIVVGVFPNRLEVQIAPRQDTRATAGSPIFSQATGKVVGVLQNVVSRDGQGLVVGTPSVQIAAAARTLKPDAQPLKLSTWTEKDR